MSGIAIGQKFGELEVIELIRTTEDEIWWRCRCFCDKVIAIEEKKLIHKKHCGCSRTTKQNLVGLKFGKLTCLEYIGHSPCGHLTWKFVCECGREKVITGNSVRYGGIIGCGVCTKRGKESVRWTGVGDLGSTYWRNIQKAAERKGLPFEITKEQAWDIFVKQDKICPLTGEDIAFTEIGTAYGGDGGTASLDRIDSSKGYTIDNVWWVNRDANMIKLDLTMSELLYWCNLIVNKDNTPYEINTDSGKQFSNWTGYRCIGSRFWSNVKCGAKKRDIEFNVTIEQAYDLYITQNGRCKFTNIPIKMFPNSKDRHLITASLDRINSDGIYEINNLQWIHRQLNRMKWHIPDDRFIEVLTEIYYLHKDNYEFTKYYKGD